VNDGSTDGTSEKIADKYPGVKVLEGNGQLWWSASTNLGVKYALSLSGSQKDFILTLNNDLVVRENYLAEFFSAAGRFPDTLIGSLAVDIEAPDTIHYAGTIWNSRTSVYRRVKMLSRDELLGSRQGLLSTSLLPGRGTLIPVPVFKKIGLYDHRQFPHYMGDEDFALRARKAGYKLGIWAGAIVYSHIHETGMMQQKKNFRYYRDFFTSIKSHGNSRYRWNWAKRHARVHPLLYFVLDLARQIRTLVLKD